LLIICRCLNCLVDTHQTISNRELGVQAEVNKLRGAHAPYFTCWHPPKNRQINSKNAMKSS
jgi:hypothetical protein